MDVNWELVGRALVGAVPAVATLAGLFRGPGPRRSRLRRDIDLLKDLPEDSKARESMLGWIDAQIADLRDLESTASRNWTSVGLGVLLSIGSGYLTFYLFSEGAWWQIASGSVTLILTLALVVVIFEAAQLAQRDKDGTKVKPT